MQKFVAIFVTLCLIWDSAIVLKFAHFVSKYIGCIVYDKEVD